MKKIIRILVVVILFFVILAINSANYLLNAWGELSFSTVLYQLLSPLQGTNQEIILQYMQEALLPSVVIVALMILIWYSIFRIFSTLYIQISGLILRRKFKINLNGETIKKNSRKIKIILGISIGVIFGYTFINRVEAVGIFEYINDLVNSSMIFEEKYVHPENVNIEFDNNAKNLIYIYMESMESTYIDEKSGGEKEINYIPNLKQIAIENISFSHNEKVGGLLRAPGTTWTMAAILGSTTGVPYKLPIEGNSAGKYTTFLPGVVSLGEILKQQGYNNYFMCGSPIAFGGRESYLTQHGDYRIYDYNMAITDGLISEDYYEFWGFEDRKLYEYAKIKLNEIASEGKKFNFTILTVDTHHAEGYICELCPQTYSEQYANVISCADVQIKNFLEWIKQQDWYEDTLIVIAGDHASMNNTFFDDVDNRNIYNCFINSAIKPEGNLKNRQACVLDMFPTTLAAMGASIEGNRLGLGTNLFSSKATLMEEMGTAQFNQEIERYSKYYIDNFVKGE